MVFTEVHPCYGSSVQTACGPHSSSRLVQCFSAYLVLCAYRHVEPDDFGHPERNPASLVTTLIPLTPTPGSQPVAFCFYVLASLGCFE